MNLRSLFFGSWLCRDGVRGERRLYQGLTSGVTPVRCSRQIRAGPKRGRRRTRCPRRPGTTQDLGAVLARLRAAGGQSSAEQADALGITEAGLSYLSIWSLLDRTVGMKTWQSLRPLRASGSKFCGGYSAAERTPKPWPGSRP